MPERSYSKLYFLVFSLEIIKSQALNFMRLSARIDATASRVQTAVTMKQVMHTL